MSTTDAVTDSTELDHYNYLPAMPSATVVALIERTQAVLERYRGAVGSVRTVE